MLQTLLASWFAPMLTLLAIVLMIVLTVYSWKDRGLHFRLSVSWIVLVPAVVSGLFCIHWATEATKQGLEFRLSNLAKVMAVSLQDAGHATLTLETPLDDPVYVNMMNTMKRWMQRVPSIASVYTVRLDAEKNYYFVTDPQADLNRNGVLDEGEEDLPIGEPYGEAFVDVPEFVDAFQGRSGFNRIPMEDDYGSWVTAAEPMYDKAGDVEAIFGVDFWGDRWVADVAASRFWPTLFYSAFLALFFSVQFFLLTHREIEGKLEKNASDLERSVEQLMLANRKADAAAKTKDEFLANMSHEIRTPMNAILGMLHLLHRTPLTEKQASYLGSAEQSTKLLLRVINDILDFSKIEAGKLEVEQVPFSLKKIFAELYGLIGEAARKKDLELDFRIAEDVPDWILGDSVRLSQVLINLIGNAIKFTEKGGVSVDANVLPPAENEEGINAAGDANTMHTDTVRLRFAIRDTGIGMSPEQRSRLFLPFAQADTSTTRKYGGTGLGLAICMGLVEIMHGEIGCESVPGQGSLFYFTAEFGLPDDDAIRRDRKDSPAESDAKEPVKAVPGENGRYHILLVEDNKINQLVAVELLAMEGYAVDVATNGLQALEKLEIRDYDLVLMDIQMPVMDGIEATRKIRQNPRFADLPILAMTAHAMSSDHEKSIAAGMNDHITKPINPDALNRCIKRWIKPS